VKLAGNNIAAANYGSKSRFTINRLAQRVTPLRWRRVITVDKIELCPCGNTFKYRVLADKRDLIPADLWDFNRNLRC
jgi:hypothetical protein